MKNMIALYIAWIIASVIAIGSLYMSEIKHYIPCNLCWYERIALFPLVILLGIALYQHRFDLFAFLAPFPILGLIISGYQIAIQEIPYFHPPATCSIEVSCSTKHFLGATPITLPMAAFLGSLCILCALLYVRKNSKA